MPTTTNLPVAEVRRDVPDSQPACEIFRDDALLFALREDLYSLGEFRLTASGPAGEYQLRGDWPNWKILVTQDERRMAEITQDPSALSDHYAVDVAPDADPVGMLCLAIAIHELTEPGRSSLQPARGSCREAAGRRCLKSSDARQKLIR